MLLAYEVNGFNINCYFHQTSYEYVSSMQTCQASGITVIEKNQTLTSVNSETGEMLYNSQSGSYLKSAIVKALTFESQAVFYMPKGIAKFFPNLEVLKITSCQLKEIDKSDLEPFKNLKVLYLNGNDLVILKDDLFEGNSQLKYLQFNSNSKLKYIGENIFDPLYGLQQAWFQSCGCVNTYANYQSNIPNLRTSLKTNCPDINKMKKTLCQDDFDVLHSEIFDLKTEIEKLHLENSMLKHKMKSMFTSCDGNLDSATKNLFLATKKLESCEKISRFDDAEGKNVNLTCLSSDGDNCEVINEFKVNFAGFIIENTLNSNGEIFDASEMKTLRIIEQQTFTLPTNIGSFFPQLTEFVVRSSGLYEVSANVFTDMKNLTVLEFFHNKIIEIPSDTFDELENLKRLDLSFNNIENLKKDVFSSLKNLEYLRLSDNKLVTINYEVFEVLSNLKELSLQNNKLKFVSANLLTPLKQISSVDLSANDCIDMSHPNETLVEIETAFIDNCIAPIELNCSFEVNQLNLEKPEDDLVCKAQELTVEYPKTKVSRVISVDEISKIDNDNVTSLIITDASAKFLPYQLAKVFPKLEKIIVENSSLTSLHKHDFKGFTQLKRIEIRRNNLSEIEDETFDDIRQIEFLDLSHNNIKNLPSKIFLSLVHLKTLILSFNQIEKFTADLLPRKNAIEEVRVDNNELELIETKILRYLRKAKTIDLTANVCIDLKFDKSDENSKTLVELSGEIDLNCSADD